MYKMVIVVNDIEMSCGKLAAQVAHAAVEAAIIAYRKRRRLFKKWMAEGAKKVVVVADEEEILGIRREADRRKIINAVIRDAGLTELAPGTLTALAIGPDEEAAIDELTGHLPLKK